MPSGYAGMTHPSVGSYNQGCRCSGCKIERTAYMRRWRGRPGNREKHNAWGRRFATSSHGKMLKRIASAERIRSIKYTSEAKEYIKILVGDPCGYCGESAEAIDHIESVAMGGHSDWDNLTATCRKCNSSKNARTLLEFLAQKE